mmetsp:Transcript_6513/g.14137  ORF Transcript_6513/g.14137 Transcript_6513/m.14137 type:complete len:99 (-) Transcript_6513:1032-1328(-)
MVLRILRTPIFETMQINLHPKNDSGNGVFMQQYQNIYFLTLTTKPFNPILPPIQHAQCTPNHNHPQVYPSASLSHSHWESCAWHDIKPSSKNYPPSKP